MSDSLPDRLDCPTCGYPVRVHQDSEGTAHYVALDEDSAGAELERCESDVMYIHDALTDAGLEGSINADSIIERIETLAALRAENERLRDRLTAFNECVRIYLGHDRQTRPGWLEEEVDATDALLNRSVETDEKCPNCHGTGEDPVPRQIGRPCPRCDGSGESRDSHPTPEEGR